MTDDPEDHVLELLRAYEALIDELNENYVFYDKNKIDKLNDELDRLIPLAGFEYVDGKLRRTVADLSIR